MSNPNIENLNIIRARNALACEKEGIYKKERGEGDHLSGYPSLIINNGLLPTLAFSIAKEKSYEQIAHCLAYHFSQHPQFEKDFTLKDNEAKTGAQKLLEHLASKDSQTLRRFTSEALEFVAFLKRILKKTKGQEDN